MPHDLDKETRWKDIDPVGGGDVVFRHTGHGLRNFTNDKKNSRKNKTSTLKNKKDWKNWGRTLRFLGDC
jgi:hypothetical protein